MSKIGKLPVLLNSGVSAQVTGKIITITGPKGTLEIDIPRGIEIETSEDKIIVGVKNENIASRALHGTIRALLANMVKGVSEGWSKKLELIGTGYRAEVAGKDLVLTVGFSHPVKIPAPKDIDFKVEKNVVTVSGIDKSVVGEVAAKVRAVKPPEPYKGKGIKYVDEFIRRKAGKAAKAGGT